MDSEEAVQAFLIPSLEEIAIVTPRGTMTMQWVEMAMMKVSIHLLSSSHLKWHSHQLLQLLLTMALNHLR